MWLTRIYLRSLIVDISFKYKAYINTIKNGSNNEILPGILNDEYSGRWFHKNPCKKALSPIVISINAETIIYKDIAPILVKSFLLNNIDETPNNNSALAPKALWISDLKGTVKLLNKLTGVVE